MLSNLLLYRFMVFNVLLGVAVTGLWYNDILISVYESDKTRLTWGITGMFIVSSLYVAREHKRTTV